VLHCHTSLLLLTDSYCVWRFHILRFHLLRFHVSRLESLEAVAAAAAENDDLRFTMQQDNERLQQQLAAAGLTEHFLDTQLQVYT
jgi:hypothetical protein